MKLHIWWHQCHCDLYCFLTTGFRESVSRGTLQQIEPDFVSCCQTNRLEHAKSIVDILTAFLDLDAELPVMDSDIAVCAYQSTRILFHAFHIGAAKFSLTADLVSEMAEICLSVLKKLARTSSIIEKIVSSTCSYSQITQLTATKQADIASLIARGFSLQSSESISASPERSQQRDQTSPISATAASRQILSRHSLVKHSQVCR